MNPTARTKGATRRLWDKWFRSLRSTHRKFRKTSKHHTTVSDTAIQDLKDTIEATRSDRAIVHDVVFPSETASGTLHLDTTNASCSSGLTNDEPGSDSPSPDGEYQVPPPFLKTRCDGGGGGPGGNLTCTCVPATAAVLPSPLPYPPRLLSSAPSTSFAKDDIVSIHTSDVDQVPSEEGIPVEITQVKRETDHQHSGDARSDEALHLHDSWGQTEGNESGWEDSEDFVLQDLSSIPPACTPPHPTEAEEVSTILQSSDQEMTLSLRDFLGAGTYGKVVSAHWREGCRSVAVKVSHKLFISELDCTEQGLRHLKNELDVLKALKQSREDRELGSNFFPDLYKSWQDVKNVYFVMEMYECSLEHLRWANLDWDATTGDKLLWAAEMILGVQALHRMRILHRDIKPANIFITSSKHIVIGDYGLARAWLDPFYANFPSTSLRARDSPGTLAYLAPEVVKGFYMDPINVEVRKYANYGFEADIWSLGVTICESWSPSAGLFSLEEGESHLESKSEVPSKILKLDILPAVKQIVGGHPVWHLIVGMLDRNQKTRIGFDEILAHPVFAHLDWNQVANLEYTATWSFPEVEPCKRPRRVVDEIEFPSYYRLPEDTSIDETGSKRIKAERQLFRRAMGAARDWVSEQPTYVACGVLFEHDFDWPAPEVIQTEGQLDPDDD